MRQATRDEIVTQIHLLWERGWKVNPSSVKEMLEKDPARTSRTDVLEKVITEYVSDERRLSCRKAGRSLEIDKSYSYQEQE